MLDPYAKDIVGAIRWDAWYGQGGPVAEVERSLGPRKFHFRLPFFAQVLADDRQRGQAELTALVDRVARLAELVSSAFTDVRADIADRWHWTGDSIVHVDGAQRSFEVIPLPTERQVVRGFRPDPPELPQDDGIVPANALPKADRKVWADHMNEFWLARPFLLGMPTAEMTKRFKVRIVRQSDKDLWLEFVPLRQADAAPFERAVLILDAERTTSGYAKALSEHAESALAESDRALRDIIHDISQQGGPHAFNQMELIIVHTMPHLLIPGLEEKSLTRFLSLPIIHM